MFGQGVRLGSIRAGGSLFFLVFGLWFGFFFSCRAVNWILYLCLAFYIMLRVETRIRASILHAACGAHPPMISTFELSYTHDSCFMMRLRPGAYTSPASLCIATRVACGRLHAQSFQDWVKYSHISCLALDIYSYKLAHSSWGKTLFISADSALIHGRDHTESGC
jgi:hypothetical protein